MTSVITICLLICSIDGERYCSQRNFYDGYVVNAVLDASYKSAKTNSGNLYSWISGGTNRTSKPSNLVEFDKDHYLIKEEMTHYGAKKLILKINRPG
jgi:hypothetical protein